MHGPPAVGWLLALLCGASGGYCLLRMRHCPPAARRTAGGEALMGAGMAVMAVPVAAVAGQAWLSWVLAIVFGLSSAAYGALAAADLPACRAGLHHAHHAVGSAAMVYMALAMPAAHAAGHAGHGAGQPAVGTPLVTGVLLGYFAMYVLRTGLRLAPLTVAGGVGTGGRVRSGGGTGGVGDGVGGTGGAGGVEDDGGRLGGRAARADPPELVTVCRVSMGLAMFTMLLAL